MTKDQAAWHILGRVTEHALNDHVWQLFGYSRRPRWGGVFNRFRANWRVQLETDLVRELMITSIAAHVLHRVADMQVVESVIVNLLNMEGMAKVLGFDTLDAAIGGLYNPICDYVATSSQEWPKLLISRLRVSEIPDPKTKAELVAGSVRYTAIFRPFYLE